MAFTAPAYLALSRHGIFYFRMSIPARLRTHLGTREVKRSLKTRHRRTAIQRARACASHFEALFATLQEHPVTYLEMKQLLEDAQARMYADLKDGLETNGPLTRDDRIKAVGEMKVLRSLAADQRYTPRAQAMADNVLAEANINLAQEPGTYQQFCVETGKMLAAVLKDYLAHNEGLDDYTITSQPEAAPPTPSPSAAPNTAQNSSLAPSVGVREVIDAYCDEKRRAGTWSAKTEQEHQAVFALFVRIVGECPVDTINAKTARDYKTVLQQLPPNLNKAPLYRGKSIEQILAMKPQRTMAINTINKNLTRISSLFAWAKKHGYVHENYFDKLAIKAKKRAHEERAPFTDDELARLFGTTQYHRHRFKHPYYYWLPLLGLHTGARLGELCQLHLADIRDADGIPVFDINDAGEKKLKSPSSQRLVPIHPKLIDLGLLDYVNRLRDKGETRLFPELKRGRDGYAQAASRWFGGYREPLGLHNQEPRKDFHSFRHTLTNTLKQQGFPEDQVAALIGHSKNNITYARYADPYAPAVLKGLIEKLDFNDALTAVQPFFQ